MQNQEENTICDWDLTHLPVRELNKQLKTSRYTKSQIQKMKLRRRTLKNRGYAASCRSKRFQRKDELEIQKREELRGIESLIKEICRYKGMINDLNRKISENLIFAKQNNIDLRPYLEESTLVAQPGN